MKQAFVKKGRPRKGDLAQKVYISFQPYSRGRRMHNYEGSYAITFATMDGGELTCPVNADAVKIYFV